LSESSKNREKKKKKKEMKGSLHACEMEVIFNNSDIEAVEDEILRVVEKFKGFFPRVSIQ